MSPPLLRPPLVLEAASGSHHTSHSGVKTKADLHGSFLAGEGTDTQPSDPFAWESLYAPPQYVFNTFLLPGLGLGSHKAHTEASV